MKILDWYIFKKFMVTFLFTILTIAVIAVVIDSSEKTDDFVKSGLPFYKIVTQYFAGFIPFIISMIFPLIVFIAVIFFTSKMAARSETVAILANGIPFPRMLWPYLLGGGFLGVILWLGMAYVIPAANERRANFQATYIDANNSYNAMNRPSQDFYFRVDSVTYVGMRGYDTASKRAFGFFLERIKGNQVYYNLRSDIIQWNAEKKKWIAERGVERTISGVNETVATKDSVLLNLNVLPTDLRRDEYLKDKLTTPQLKKFIAMERLRGGEGINTYLVELYRRDATPVAVVILTLIGVAVSARKTRGGSGLNLALGIVMAALFVIMDKFSTVFSTKGNLPPMLAAWLPNVIFSFVAFIMYRKAPK